MASAPSNCNLTSPDSDVRPHLTLKAKVRQWLFLFASFLPRSLAVSLKRVAYFLEVFRKTHVPRFGYVAGHELFGFVIEKEGFHEEDFDYLEFGVSVGTSLSFWAANCRHQDARFYGFDTFQGIPEDWGNVAKGAYSARGVPPDIQDQRVSFVIGLFSDTLPEWLEHASLGRRKVIHLDADLYSSTLFVLCHLLPLLRRDDILIFDEFFSVTKADHEYRAFADALMVWNLQYVPIAKSSNQFAVKVV
jgi:hypothetical protein